MKKSVFLSALIFSVLVFFLQIHTAPYDRSILSRLDFIIYDWRQQMSQWLAPLKVPTAPKIVIVDIDEASLKAEGRWPWSRYRLASLFKILQSDQAAVVTFDMVFSEPERTLINELKQAEQWQKNNSALSKKSALIASLSKLFRPDIAFAKAMATGDGVLGFFFQNNKNDRVGYLPPPIARITKKNQQFVIIQKPGYVMSLPFLQKAAGNTGFVTTFPDADGVIRRTPIIIRHGNNLYPSLALATVMSFLLEDHVTFREQKLGNIQSITALYLGKTRIPTDASGRVLVPYYGRSHRFQYISATNLLHHRINPSQLDGAIVFVGTSSIGLSDLVTTPLATSFPGVEVQASIAAGLLQDDFPYRPDWEAGATLMTLIVIAFWLILLLPRLPPLLLILTAILTAQAIVILNLFFWIKLRLDLPLASILILIAGLTLLYLLSGFISEKTSRKQLHDMFGQYVPEAHIEKMLMASDGFSMEGESKELTVLFSDIRSFTTLSEKLSATELKKLLNFYFTPITKIIFQHGGTIDKYVGDMVMAFWGAPVEDPHHRKNAIAAALDMIKITEQLKPELRARQLPEINVGIGLNTGFMNVGDMGSKYRKAYTVLGDAVNLGSRLESLTKFYGIKIMLGENTVNGIKQFRFRFIDRIRVKGKDDAINAYEPIGEVSTLSAETEALLQRYQQAIDHYHQKKWQEAKNILEILNTEQPTKLFQIYLQRIEEFLQQPPDESWDGAYTHTSK